MKKILLFLLFALQVTAQEKIYETSEVQTQPEFPGGTKAFHGNVNSYFFLKLAGFNRQNNGVDFTVEKDGTISNLTVLGNQAPITKNDLPGFQKTCPLWKPATVNGKPVRCHIRYELHGFSDSEIVLPGNNDRVIGNTPLRINDPDHAVYSMTGVEKKPEFPGGTDKLKSYIEKNFKRPTEKVAGKVFVTFVVEKDGALSDIKVLRDQGFGTKEEAIRVLKSSPKWIPGQLNGKNVRVLYTMPIIVNSEHSSAQIPRPTINGVKMDEDLSAVPLRTVPNDSTVFHAASIQQLPEFPGGLGAFYQKFHSEFKMPNDQPDLKGKVFVTFIVEKDGTLSDLKILRDIGYGIGAEAIRVMKTLPKWTPGMHDGKAVRCQYSLPIAIPLPPQTDKNIEPIRKK